LFSKEGILLGFSKEKKFLVFGACKNFFSLLVIVSLLLNKDLLL
jgi:hypothetical protein